MTRAMDTLVMTRARYRRRYGSDMPEASIPSRFLEEVPSRLVEDLGSPPARPQFSGSDYGNAYATPYPKANRFGGGNAEAGERHYSYEDEDQSAPTRRSGDRSGERQPLEVQQDRRSRPVHRQHRQLLCRSRTEDLAAQSWTFPSRPARPG